MLVLATGLIAKNNKIKIINYDLSIFGDEHLPNNNNFVINDLRNIEDFKVVLRKHNDTVLQLACISNDPTFDCR